MKPIKNEWERYRSIPAFLRALEDEQKSELPWFSFNVYDLLESCRKRIPGLPEHQVALYFSPSRMIACINTTPGSCRIRMHSVLNRPDVPREVIEYILLHELVHLVVPPRAIDGKMKVHPPEFWEFAQSVSGSGQIIWSWIWLVIMDFAQKDEEREGIYIDKTWKKKTKHPYPTLDFIRECFDYDNMPEEKVMELI